MRSTIFFFLAVLLSALSVSAQRRNIVTGSITASGQSVVSEVIDRPSCTVILSGTFSLTPVFEASIDSSVWIPVSMVRSSDGTQTQAPGAIATATAWEQNLTGFKWFRLRCSAYTSGTGVVTISTTDVTVAPTPGTMVTTFASTQPVSATISGTPAVTISGTPTVTATMTSTTLGAKTTGGALYKKVLAAAGTNATSVKASAGILYGMVATNTTAATKWVRIYAKASAPTVGTDVSILTFAIPPNNTIDFQSEVGITIATGIALSITGAGADNDATAVVANDVALTLVYN